MFIDFLAMMLIDLVIALVMFAWFFFRIEADRKQMAPGFLMTGFLSLVGGLYICFKWPLPGSYNITFGEPAVLFGLLFFTLGIALLKDWDLTSIGIFAFFAGIVAVIVGIRILGLGFTKEPLATFLGFLLTGLVGIVSLPGYWLRKYPIVRMLVALAALGAALVWGITGFGAYWSHPASFAKWTPGG
jgi:putative membrane protein